MLLNQLIFSLQDCDSVLDLAAAAALQGALQLLDG